MLEGLRVTLARSRRLAGITFAMAASVVTYGSQLPNERASPLRVVSSQSGAAADLMQRAALRDFYEHRNGALLWSLGGSVGVSTRKVIQALRSASDFGLSPEQYSGDALAAQLERLTRSSSVGAQEWERFDTDVSTATLRFINDLHFGRVNPRAGGFAVTRRNDTFDAAAYLEKLAGQPDPAAVFAQAEPNFVHYRLLKQALVRYRALAAGLIVPLLPPLPRHQAAARDTYTGAPALRQLLAELGDLPAERATDTRTTLDPALVTALMRFQYRHGLREDGILGKTTLAALETPLAQRVRQIELTLERWRWLPPFQPPAIVVNIPQFRLFLFKTDVDTEADMLRMNVIVGQEYPRLNTPVFTAEMDSVVFRPYWDVPDSILRHEILPQLRKHPLYLETQNMELVDNGPGHGTLPKSLTAATVQDLSTGALRVRQQPGPDNALGLIKFVLPNPFGVYLHSTPAPQLFSQARRALSHGCIRIGDPAALAAEVLRGTSGDWTLEKIQAAMNGDATFTVRLAHPVHVLILYGTAVASEDGAMHFFEDIYGHDRRLEALLGLKPVMASATGSRRSQHLR